MIFIAAPILLGHQTATMVNRTLTDMTYSEGVPMSGRCNKCGRLFTTQPDALAQPGDATRDFYAAFGAHECTDQA